MNRSNNCFENIMQEILKQENQEIMDSYEQKIADLEHEKEIKIDENILKMFIEYDNQKNKNKKKRYISILSKVAILILICSVSISFVLPEEVAAFRPKFFNILFNEDSGALQLRGQTEIDYIGEWYDYYYPQHMPTGYELLAAKKMGDRKVMLYAVQDSEHQLKIEQLPTNSTMSIDSDHIINEKIKIGHYEGIYSISEEYDYVMVTFLTENSIICINGDLSIDKDEYIKIAENFKYIER